MFSKYFIAKMLSQYLELHIKANSNPDYVIFVYISVLFLYPRHLCRGVYSFRLSVRPFVCLFVIPSRSWNLRQSFALKFLKWCISQQLLIRKHSHLDHSYPGGLAFTP